MSRESTALMKQRLQKLKSHLARENPVLLQIVKTFRILDSVAQGLGLLNDDESYATQVPWWPTISVLGTYSSGKSTFINHLLGYKLQASGNQAVDDKFTVICYGEEEPPRTLPGMALDADMRFAFYQISHEIEGASTGEGKRIDVYLQLKTCPAEILKGKIIIDSPGFDADAQRTSTLRITNHIMDLSDLVLVFFDARHPEPGTMQDTLQHLVADTIARPDSNKFLYILNQIDATAREDNPEEVFAAWQRALSQKGLTAGRFYRLYTPEAAVAIENAALRDRFKEKRDADMAEVRRRMDQVEIERAYRIIGVLEETARHIEADIVPALEALKHQWRRRLAWSDLFVFGGLAAAAGMATISLRWWDEFQFLPPPWLQTVIGDWRYATAAGVVVLAVVLYIHFWLRGVIARSLIAKLRRAPHAAVDTETLVRGFRKSTSPAQLAWLSNPAGWGGGARRRIARILRDADGYIQTLNDMFTDPSGEHKRKGGARKGKGAPEAGAPQAPQPSATESSTAASA